jgi:hypothetical protein
MRRLPSTNYTSDEASPWNVSNVIPTARQRARRPSKATNRSVATQLCGGTTCACNATHAGRTQ